MRNNLLFFFFSFFLSWSYAQENSVLSYAEFLGHVKKHHPIVKQANLVLDESEAMLLKARGSFDPKLELQQSNKTYAGSTYYDKITPGFKIPTWYGIEISAEYQDMSGQYLNPEAVVPDEGLYNVGVSVPLARGLLMNERMATIKKAKIYLEQAEAENQLMVNDILFKASKSYFKWLAAYQKVLVFEEFVSNAEMRLQGVITSFNSGDKPAIDTTEARINLSNRELSLEKARLTYIKSGLELSNFLWINDIPVELTEGMQPELDLNSTIDQVLLWKNFVVLPDLSSHPVLRTLDAKEGGLEVERGLKRNNLLPQVDLKYSLLTETPQNMNSFSTENYMTGLAVSFPLFTRKERGDLKLTNYKLQAIAFEKQATELSLSNSIRSIQQEIFSYEDQLSLASNIVTDYSTLLQGEEQRFTVGESSLFVVNLRESKLIENRLKVIDLENMLLNSKGSLMRVMANF